MTRTTDRVMTPEMTGAAIRAFRSANCPACGGDKIKIADPFCLKCLDLLTPELHAAVCDNSQFLESYHPALEHIEKASEMQKPKA